MEKKIVVYSCVTGGYDSVSKTLLASKAKEDDNIEYVLFTDQIEQLRADFPNSRWNFKWPVWTHPLCSRRTARWHKVNSHLLFKGVDYTLWIDGSQAVNFIDIRKDLVDMLMLRYEIAAFKHPDRMCVYQELKACIRLKKDNPELMTRQVKGYQAEGYPPYNGLVETACVLRKNCQNVTDFNRAWWQELDKHSYRDQLSFNYVAWKLKQKYGIIPGSGTNSKYFTHRKHGNS